MDDPYRDLLAEWFMRHYEEALRSVTRCALGDVHRAEEAISVVLERMWRNRKTYEHRVFRGTDDDIYILCVDKTDGKIKPILLTDYIVGAACNQLRRPGPQHSPLPPNLVAQPDGQARQWFVALRPCLDRLGNFDQLIAVASYLEDNYFALRPFFAEYVCGRVMQTWPGHPNPTCFSDPDLAESVYEVAIQVWQTRNPNTKRADRSHGLQSLRQCLHERGLGFPP